MLGNWRLASGHGINAGGGGDNTEEEEYVDDREEDEELKSTDGEPCYSLFFVPAKGNFNGGCLISRSLP